MKELFSRNFWLKIPCGIGENHQHTTLLTYGLCRLSNQGYIRERRQLCALCHPCHLNVTMVLKGNFLCLIFTAISCPALADQPGQVLRSGCLHYPPATELLGTTCHWYCPYGYGGVGNPQSTCLANSTWDVVDFTCEGVCAVVNPISKQPHMNFTLKLCLIKPLS